MCPSLPGSAPSTSETVGRPMEILFVEDTLTFARLTIGVLQRGSFRHRLTWVKDGEEATEFLQREGKYSRAPVPDLILLDLGLPKRTGREVLRDLRADEKLATKPVVIMTASPEHQSEIEEEGLSVQGYLTKPVNLDEFLSLLGQLNRFWQDDMTSPTTGQS